MSPSTLRTKILWRQVWGIAALMAAIVFSFMVYGYYQPRILSQLGFVWLAANLGILQGFLGVLVEPLVGALSDRVAQKVGNRLPVIATGVTLAGLIFVALSLLLLRDMPVGFRWLVPLLMTVWVIAMIVFRGPAIALLRQFAPTADLPKANAILTFVFGVVGALGPMVGLLLQGTAAPLTFLLGAGTLVVGAMLLYSSKPQLQIPAIAIAQPPVPLLRLSLLFGVGLGAGIVLNIVLRVVPTEFAGRPWGVTTEYVAAAVLLTSAITAVPLERTTQKIGVRQSMGLGLAAMTGLVGIAPLIDSAPLTGLVILALGSAFGLVFISQIPFALGTAPPIQAGLSTGLYFGGIGAGTAVLSLLLNQVKDIMPLVEFGWAVAGTAIAVVGINKLTPSHGD